MDKGSKKPGTWISGPAGSGKTTLVVTYLDARNVPCIWYSIDRGDNDLASFFYHMGLAVKQAAPRFRKPLPLLTPEYLLGVPTFTRRFFEKLYGRLKPPFAIVLDNYQDVPEGSTLHDVISTALSLVPDGMRVFVVSRNEPAPAFARLRANDALHLVGWNDLRLTLDESKQIVLRKMKRLPDARALAALHDKTGGWAAGLVLLMEGSESDASAFGTDADRSRFFDYFAREVFDKLNNETRDFLLLTALLPSMTVRTAEKLTGKDKAQRILGSLNRNHFFTEKQRAQETTYQYHPLFREFLLSRLKETLKEEDMVRLKKRAASVLEEQGQIENALVQYHAAGAWENAVPLILGNAETMMRQGRNKTLETWLDGVPPGLRASVPWLLFWTGMCRMGYEPAAARLEFERAFTVFSTQSDPVGTALSWSMVIDTYQFEWNDYHPLDGWITIYFDKVDKLLSAVPPEVRLRVMTAIGLALTLRQPGHPRAKAFNDLAVSLAAESHDKDSGLYALMSAGLYYSWVGDQSRCIETLEEMRRTTSSSQTPASYRMTALVFSAVGQGWDVSRAEEMERKISAALAFGTSEGIHVWDHVLYTFGVYSALVLRDTEKAERYLEQMQSSPVPLGKGTRVLHHMANYLFQFSKRNLSAALRHAEAALKLAEECGYVFAFIVQLHAMAQLLHALNDRKAEEYLDRALEQALLAKSVIIEFGCRMAQALFAFDGGNEEKGTALLKEALSLGKERGYYSLPWWWDAAGMSRLAMKALERGIETDYVKDLVRIRNLAPEEPPVHVEHWPWPLRIFTLGKFGIEKDGKPLIFTGKVQKKPLDMLKFLIASGGKDVPEAHVIDALWPDAEGDAGHKSFENTVARLRKLLGNDTYLLLQEGKLTLDPGSCWVDAFAFASRTEEAIHSLRRPDPGSSSRLLLEKAFSLYSGPFLAGDGKAWVMSTREKLKSRCLALISGIAGHERNGGNWDTAIHYLLKGIEIDELAEDLVRELMVCYQKAGREVDAIKAYMRLKTSLSAALGVEPSSSTEALYRQVLAR